MILVFVFASKWSSLYDSACEEGIREPIKVYEFMNKFYVEEGNKRVSVSKSIGDASIPGNVIRLLPPKTDDPISKIYYEYIDFYNFTSSDLEYGTINGKLNAIPIAMFQSCTCKCHSEWLL